MAGSLTRGHQSAPWREHFLQDVSKLSMPICVLATLHPSPSSDARQHRQTCVPRARTVVFRGMWGSLPENDRNPAPRNDALFESDLLTLTTDARMDKVPELFSSSGTGELGESSSVGKIGTGGGGAVEAVFWIPDSMMQWRIRGIAYVIAPDAESEKGARMREALQARMRTIAGSSTSIKTWSWTRELTAHFGNLSPKMRGSFRNPPSGVPRTAAAQDIRLGLGQEVTDLDDTVARENFRVVVIVPDEVDQVDLENQRRWVHGYSQAENKWQSCEVWP